MLQLVSKFSRRWTLIAPQIFAESSSISFEEVSKSSAYISVVFYLR